MRILGFDTATRATAVALWSPDGLALEARDDPATGERPRHTTRLMGLIVELLEQASLSWGDIDRLAVGLGPGTFTGLRIGVATARALGSARKLPLVGVSTLESLALGGIEAIAERGDALRADRPPDAVLAAIDARRGEAFAAAWSAERRPLMDARAIDPAQLAADAAGWGRSVLAVGDGAVEFRGVLERAGVLVPGDRSPLHRVTAINHCRLAESRPESLPDQIRPDYLRLPDAEIARRTAHRQ